jgi:hypothetical protein
MEAAWREYCEAEHSSSDDESSEADFSESEGGSDHGSRPTAALGMLPPLDIRFSQMKMRHLFGDGRRIAQAIEAIKTVPCSEEEAAAHPGAKWRLEFPFPAIEVVRWRCKLRDSTGRPRLDPKTMQEMYDSEENWFTLDNRRLYCLQEASMRVWPDRCVARVSEVLGCGPRHHMCALRKFRTMDSGRSLMVGSCMDEVGFVRWSWREKAGIQQPQEDDAAAKAAEARGADQKRDVLEFLEGLKQDDSERVDVSKKLSFILRREHGARSMGLVHGEGGWLLVKDLLQLEFLEGVTRERFHELVAESNRQKKRYEIQDSERGERIRACGNKAPASSRADAGATPAVGSSAPATQRAAALQKPPGIHLDPRSSARTPIGASNAQLPIGVARPPSKPVAKGEGPPGVHSPPGVHGPPGALKVGETLKAAATRTLAARNGVPSSSSSSRLAGPAGDKPPSLASMFQQMQAMHGPRGVQMMQYHMSMMRQMQAMSTMQLQQTQAMYMAYTMKVRRQLAQLRAARQAQEYQAQAHMYEVMQQEMEQMYRSQGVEWTQQEASGDWGATDDWYGADGAEGSSKWFGQEQGELGDYGWGGQSEYDSHFSPTQRAYSQASSQYGADYFGGAGYSGSHHGYYG